MKLNRLRSNIGPKGVSVAPPVAVVFEVRLASSSISAPSSSIKTFTATTFDHNGTLVTGATISWVTGSTVISSVVSSVSSSTVTFAQKGTTTLTAKVVSAGAAKSCTITST